MTTPASAVDLESGIIDALATVKALGDLLAAAGVSEIALGSRATLTTTGELLRREATIASEAVEQLVRLAHRAERAQEATRRERMAANRKRVSTPSRGHGVEGEPSPAGTPGGAAP